MEKLLYRVNVTGVPGPGWAPLMCVPGVWQPWFLQGISRVDERGARGGGAKTEWAAPIGARGP